jgi:hypothetical protein
MAGTRECNSAVTAGRLSKAIEFFDAAEHLEDDMPNAAGDLFVNRYRRFRRHLLRAARRAFVQRDPTAKPSLCWKRRTRDPKNT